MTLPHKKAKVFYLNAKRRVETTTCLYAEPAEEPTAEYILQYVPNHVRQKWTRIETSSGEVFNNRPRPL